MDKPTFVNVLNLVPYTPPETIELVSRAGVKKGTMRPEKMFLSAISAGCLLSFGCATSLITGTLPWFQENAPGISRMIAAMVFPLGFDMVVLTGADLFTASNMFTTVAVLHRRLPVWRMLLHWFLCFWGNFAGSLFVMALIFGYGGVFDASPFRDHAIAFATKKQITPEFHQIFLRGIGCNWLVCLACYMATQAKDFQSKIVGMWLPIFTFVLLGFDHVVANMFFIPLGIWLHTPGLTVELYIWKGVIPATLGNIVGGALFCGGFYWWMHLFREPPVEVDGITYDESMRRFSGDNAVSRTKRRPMDVESGDHSNTV